MYRNEIDKFTWDIDNRLAFGIEPVPLSETQQIVHKLGAVWEIRKDSFPSFLIIILWGLHHKVQLESS
jgi:hypothetical protein